MDKLEQWQKHLDEDKKLIDEGRKHQDNLLKESPIDWQITMRNSFANHHAQDILSSSQLGNEGLDYRAFQYLDQTPSSVSNLDGSRNYSDMPVRKLDFTPAAFATRLV